MGGFFNFSIEMKRVFLANKSIDWRAQGRGSSIGHCRNVRGLGKSMVIFCLFENLRYSNERTIKFESFNSNNSNR